MTKKTETLIHACPYKHYQHENSCY